MKSNKAYLKMCFDLMVDKLPVYFNKQGMEEYLLDAVDVEVPLKIISIRHDDFSMSVDLVDKYENLYEYVPLEYISKNYGE
jgi:hypothetical protein